jgi:Helix-turn-helix domain
MIKIFLKTTAAYAWATAVKLFQRCKRCARRRRQTGTSEAKAALGCGNTKLYDLINRGLLDAVRFGKRTYITATSLEALVASLPPVVTPTMEARGASLPPVLTPSQEASPASLPPVVTPTIARAEHDRWSGHRGPPPKPQEDEPGASE